jgi:hypothetical protein
MPHLVRFVQRIPRKGAGVRVKANPAGEPNFYEMPYVGRDSVATPVPVPLPAMPPQMDQAMLRNALLQEAATQRQLEHELHQLRMNIIRSVPLLNQPTSIPEPRLQSALVNQGLVPLCSASSASQSHSAGLMQSQWPSLSSILFSSPSFSRGASSVSNSAICSTNQHLASSSNSNSRSDEDGVRRLLSSKPLSDTSKDINIASGSQDRL